MAHYQVNAQGINRGSHRKQGGGGMEHREVGRGQLNRHATDHHRLSSKEPEFAAMSASCNGPS
eukprot:6471149-Lingulodinium_polyedra.AAC.1